MKNLLFFIITIISLLLLLVEVKKYLFQSQSKIKKKNEYINFQYKKYYKRLLVYFIAQVIIFGPFTVSRFLESFGFKQKLKKQEWWNFLKEILLSSTGLVFSGIYGYMNNKFKFEIKRNWDRGDDLYSSDSIKLDDFDRAILDELSSDSEENEYDGIGTESDSANIFM